MQVYGRGDLFGWYASNTRISLGILRKVNLKACLWHFRKRVWLGTVSHAWGWIMYLWSSGPYTLVICRSWKQALRLSSIFSNLGMLFYSLPIKEKEDIRTWIKYLTLAYGFAQHERYVGWPGQIAILFFYKLWCSLQHASWDIKYLGFTWSWCWYGKCSQ